MNFSVKKAGIRIYHFLAGAIVKRIPYPEQEIISSDGSLMASGGLLETAGVRSVLVCCSRSVHRNGLLNDMLADLEKRGISYQLFEDINPNPTVGNIDTGLSVYLENKCEGIIAVGGGSPMDCAKIIALRVSNPTLSYKDMRNMLKIRHRIPYMIAVPTTAGTGSESTVAAVISDPEHHDKYVVLSPLLMPHAVLLDEGLTRGLSPAFTAYTGMDALTHAIEAYIGVMDEKNANAEALEACRLIFENLQTAYHEPENAEARRNMLIASNKAGIAFGRIYIGNIHAISHALSALYNVGHGKTNAILLPKMLSFYGPCIYKKMGDIARYCGLCDSSADSEKNNEELTRLLIERIKNLNGEFDIPEYVEELCEEDIPLIVGKALHEANPAYPVPKILNHRECTEFVKCVSRGDSI